MNRWIEQITRKKSRAAIWVKYSLTLVLCAAITALILPIWKKHLYATHTLLEMSCILLAFSTFVINWVTYEKNSFNNCVIGFGFLSVAIFDILHTFFYQTTFYEYAYCREITTKFWILGRLFEAVILWVAAFRFAGKKTGKVPGILIVLSLVAFFSFLVFQFPYDLRLWVTTGMTSNKIILEFLIIFLLVVSYITLDHNKDKHKGHYEYMSIAILLAITAEFNFTVYKNNLSSFYPALGHILRVACYGFLSQGVFTFVADYPFKKLECQLNHSLNLFETAFENAPIGMAMISIKGEWIKVNNTLCSFLGYSKDELAALKYSDITYPDDIAIFDKGIATLVNEKQELFNAEMRYYDKFGAVFWVMANMSLVQNHKGEPLYLVAQIENITEKKRARELAVIASRNEEIIKEQLELERLRTEFFANLSHEFRTPLNVILGAQQLIELYLSQGDKVEVGKIKKKSAAIKQNCLRLLRLINNLIDITKIDAGFYKINLKNHNIVSIVEDITLSVAEYINNKGVSLLFDTDIEEKIMACDPDKIERIILNIISNALKYTGEGGLIMVNLHDLGHSIEITIKDTGTGIPEDKLNMIFERFIQVDKSTTRNREGSGIGLSLVKSLVNMHSGEVFVESKYGEGCKMIVILPCILLDEEHPMESCYANKMRSDHIERINVEFSDIYFGE